MKIAVSQAVGQADLRTPDMNRSSDVNNCYPRYEQGQVTSTTATHSDALKVFSSIFFIAQSDTSTIDYLISWLQKLESLE